MRKELQAKLNATIKTPLKNKETKSKKETVINSPWIKPGGNNASGRHSKKTFKTATWTRHNCWGRSGSSRCGLVHKVWHEGYKSFEVLLASSNEIFVSLVAK